LSVRAVSIWDRWVLERIRWFLSNKAVLVATREARTGIVNFILVFGNRQN